MPELLREYLPILLFLGIAIGLAGVIVLASYLVAILFIIFDLEVAFLFPWAVSLGKFATGAETIFAFWSMMVFLGVLTVGFVYEWKKGALEWE